MFVYKNLYLVLNESCRRQCLRDNCDWSSGVLGRGGVYSEGLGSLLGRDGFKQLSHHLRKGLKGHFLDLIRLLLLG